MLSFRTGVLRKSLFKVLIFVILILNNIVPGNSLGKSLLKDYGPSSRTYVLFFYS